MLPECEIYFNDINNDAAMGATFQLSFKRLTVSPSWANLKTVKP